ncbi:hypothetical protein C1645_740838 [Glomus cerebriforme]|uniref:Uncharacterized protein n=1 Tax=Glomus cerebriforme TaxID=658196 RepID=A0A397SUN4_9GLOM|nr:hypothetical protein C1645_740838 [Glomus cerebriforme]
MQHKDYTDKKRNEREIKRSERKAKRNERDARNREEIPLNNNQPEIWKNRECITKKKPRLDRLYDWVMCTLLSEVPGSILSCGHSYHAECFIQVNQKCPYCYEYLCDGIKYHYKVFQNTLSKAFDNSIGEDSEDLENQENLQDNNVDEIVFIDKDINKKLEEALGLFRLCELRS